MPERGSTQRTDWGLPGPRRRCKREGSSWPRSTMQKGIRLNDGHVASLGLLARKDGTRKGYLSKRSSDNTKWQTKWFALLQNLLFYFESDSSSRPSGLYLLEGCVCDRAPSPKPALSAKEPLEKQVRPALHLTSHHPGAQGLRLAGGTQTLVPALLAPLAQRMVGPSRWVTPWVGRGCRDSGTGSTQGFRLPFTGKLPGSRTRGARRKRCEGRWGPGAKYR